MTPVIWSAPALGDFEALGKRIAEFSPDAERRFHQQIAAAIDRLARFPQSGRIVPEYGEPRFREVIASPYRVLYLFEPDQIEIIAVIHGAMDLMEGDGEPEE